MPLSTISSLSLQLLGGCSLPNSQFFPDSFPISGFGVSELQILGWNGRGICLADPAARSSMGCHVKRISKLAHILCFQEVHGLSGDVVHQFNVWLPGWTCLSSHALNDDGCSSPNSGGVVTLVCPKLCAGANFDTQVLVPGRCICTPVLSGDRVLTVCNVHNYGLSLFEIKSIKSFLFNLCSNIEFSPSKMLGILIGDINTKAEHERSFKIGGNFVRT